MRNGNGGRELESPTSVRPTSDVKSGNGKGAYGVSVIKDIFIMKKNYYFLAILFWGFYFSLPLFAGNYQERELIIQTLAPLSGLSKIQTASASKRDPILKKYLLKRMETLRAPRYMTHASISGHSYKMSSAQKTWSNLYRLVFDEDVDLKTALKLFQKDPNIVFVQPNFIYHTSEMPNDPYYSQQWSIPFVKADQAWDITTGSSNIVIADVDTGVDWQHEDLVNSIWTNSKEIPDDGIDNDGNGYIDDVRG